MAASVIALRRWLLGTSEAVRLASSAYRLTMSIATRQICLTGDVVLARIAGELDPHDRAALHGDDLYQCARRLAPRMVQTTLADYVRLPRYTYRPALVNYERQGPEAVRHYLRECRELGFDIVEVSSGFITLPADDLVRLVKLTADAYGPNDRRSTSGSSRPNVWLRPVARLQKVTTAGLNSRGSMR